MEYHLETRKPQLGGTMAVLDRGADQLAFFTEVGQGGPTAR
jgi:hypothetical protein